MEAAQSDALVFFGASGDLAFKQIFPALLGLVGDEGVSVPIVGVAKAGWKLEQLMTTFQKVAGHRAPHNAETDETDLCHSLRLQRGGNHGSGYDVYHAQVMEGDLVNRLQVAMSMRV